MKVNEIFGPTLQGEGPYSGHKAIFVRLWGCVAPFCDFCDSKYSWNKETEKTECCEMNVMKVVEEIEKLGDESSIIVITGGEPFMQKEELFDLVDELNKLDYVVQIETSGKVAFDFHDVEMEIVCSPKQYDGEFVVSKEAIENSDYFKFVVENKEEMYNVVDFIVKNNIPADTVYIMPKGMTKEEQERTLPIVAELCMKYTLTLCPRLHIMLWDDKRGV